MTFQLPPLPDNPPAIQTPEKGYKWLIISIAATAVIFLMLLAFGVYYYLAYIRVNLAAARHEAIIEKSSQMHPEFLDLLDAIHSVLDEPADEMQIGKVEEQGSAPYVDKAKALLEAKEYGELNALLSSCYTDKLMTKEGFFIYRLMIETLSEMKGVDKWVTATGGSHAHVSAGLAEIKLAWDARGNGFSNTVTKDRLQGFRSHLKIATKHYKAAIKEDEHNSVVLGLLMTIGLGRGQLEGMIPKMIKIGAEYTPEDGELTTRISYYLTPRWHGSRNQIITFVRDDLKKWPNTGGKFDCLISRLDLATQWGNLKFLSTSPVTGKVYDKMIKKYKESWPDGSYVTIQIAKLLIKNKCYREAIAFCQQHEEDFRNKADFYFYSGKAVFYTKQYAKAKKLLGKALDAGADDALTYFYLGRAALRAEDYETGESASLKAAKMLSLSDSWEKARAYAQVSKCVSMRSDFSSALDYASKSIEIDPEQALSWYLRGFANYRLNKKKEAGADFLKATQLDSSYEAMINLDCQGWRKW